MTPWTAILDLADASPDGRLPSPRWARQATDLDGERNLVASLDITPSGRLVVLGDGGSGKTVLLVNLVRTLLRRQLRPDPNREQTSTEFHNGEPVPVLLSIAGWGPADKSLRGFIERSLATDPRASRSIPKARKTHIGILLDEELVLPVLDGLDEVSLEAMITVIRCINDWMGASAGIVVACRTDEYRRIAAHTEGLLIDGAAAIEMCPLVPDRVINYLETSSPTPAAAARWEPVRGELLDRAAPIWMAFRTPLMVAIARDVYNARPGEYVLDRRPDPVELLDRSRFPSSEAIRSELFESFLSVMYGLRAKSKSPPWTKSEARRWLVHLIRDLPRRSAADRTEFAWWELRNVVPRGIVGLGVAAPISIVAAFGLSFELSTAILLTSGLLIRADSLGVVALQAMESCTPD